MGFRGSGRNRFQAGLGMLRLTDSQVNSQGMYVCKYVWYVWYVCMYCMYVRMYGLYVWWYVHVCMYVSMCALYVHMYIKYDRVSCMYVCMYVP